LTVIVDASYGNDEPATNKVSPLLAAAIAAAMVVYCPGLTGTVALFTVLTVAKTGAVTHITAIKVRIKFFIL
jgi:hypothetical protein